MLFDINEPVFDEQGTYLEEPALRYEHALMEQFTTSPEGQAITQTGTELGWAGVMIHYSISYLGVTPPTMTESDLEEVVFGLFPRKVITARLPVAASQADAGTLDGTFHPTPGAGAARIC